MGLVTNLGVGIGELPWGPSLIPPGLMTTSRYPAPVSVKTNREEDWAEMGTKTFGLLQLAVEKTGPFG